MFGNTSSCSHHVACRWGFGSGLLAVSLAPCEFDLEMRFHPPPTLSHNSLRNFGTFSKSNRISLCLVCCTCAVWEAAFTHSLGLLSPENGVCESMRVCEDFLYGHATPLKGAHSHTSYPECECARSGLCVCSVCPQGYRVIIFIKHAASLAWASAPSLLLSPLAEPHPHEIKTIYCGQYALTDTDSHVHASATYLNKCVYNRISHAFPTPFASPFRLNIKKFDRSGAPSAIHRPRLGCEASQRLHNQL